MRLLRQLDPASQRAVRFFVVRLLVVLLVPVALLVRGPEVYLATVLTLCVVYTTVAAVMAMIRGERPDAPSLNGWDEALAFCLVAGLVRAAAWILA